MGIIDDLAALFDSSIDVQNGNLNPSGDWLASGANSEIMCRYEGGIVRVKDRTGQEVAASLFAIVGGVLPNLDVDRLRFTVPQSRFDPWSELQAIRIDPITDETGVIGAEVYFP